METQTAPYEKLGISLQDTAEKAVAAAEQFAELEIKNRESARTLFRENFQLTSTTVCSSEDICQGLVPPCMACNDPNNKFYFDVAICAILSEEEATEGKLKKLVNWANNL